MCESKNMDIELSLLIWEKLTFYYHFNVIDSSPTFSILMLLKFESWYQLSKNSLTQPLVTPRASKQSLYSYSSTSFEP